MVRLSRLFLGPGDIFFGKVMTKTDLPYSTAGDLRPAGEPSPTIDDSKIYVGDWWFCFRHNIFKIISMT